MENMDIYRDLLNEAKKASENAYAPYSNFHVGACALYDNDKKYLGCNVENASYGLTLCAERNAISTAISNGEMGKLKMISIYSPNKKLCYPCGACRQWMSEFSSLDNDVLIVLEDNDSNPKVMKLSEIFPFGFNFD